VEASGFQDTCNRPPSKLVELDLTTGGTSEPVDLGRPVSDVAVDPRDGAVLLVLPCENGGALGRVKGNAVEVLSSVSGAYDLAINEQSLVLGGRISGPPEKGQMIRFDLTKEGFTVAPQTRTFVLSPLQVVFKSQSSKTGFISWIPSRKISRFMI